MYVALYGGLCPRRSEVSDALGAGVTGWEPPNVGLGIKLGSFEELYAFLTTDPSLQSQHFLPKTFICPGKMPNSKGRQ